MSPAGPNGEFAGIATRIKEVRIHLGLTQEEFAETIGVTRTHLADFETYRVDPSLRAVCGILRMDLVLGQRALPINCRWLMFGDGQMLGRRRKGVWADDGAAEGPAASEDQGSDD